MSDPIEVWPVERSPELAELLRACIPYEDFDPGELGEICWEELPQVSDVHRGALSSVMGSADGSSAVAVSFQHFSRGDAVGVIRSIAVHPDHQGKGTGRALLDHAMSWFGNHGAQEIRVGAGGPRYLWPGIDVRNVGALALAESAGFVPTGAEFNISLGQIDAPGVNGAQTERIESGGEAAAQTLAHCARTLPLVVPELVQSMDRGFARATIVGDRIVAYGFHSANRRGWIGPMQAVNEDIVEASESLRLLAQALVDDIARLGSTGEMCWVGPLGRSLKLFNGSVSATYRRYKMYLV